MIGKRFESYSMQKYAFSALGINIFSERGTRFVDKPLRFLLIHIGIFVSLIAQYFYLRENIKDILKAADGLFLFIGGVMVFIKWNVFLFKRNDIVDIMKKLNKMSKEASAPKEQEIWNSLNWREQILGTVYFIICWGVTILMFLQCALDLCCKFILKHKDVELTLPIIGIYFYDNSKIWFHLLTCFFNACFMFHIVNCEVGVDSTFSWFVHNIAVHFRILRLRFESMANDIVAAHELNDEKLVFNLKTLLVYHREVLNFVHEFDEVYCFNIFIQVVYSCLQLFICSFLLTVATDIQTMALMIVSLSSVMLQTIFYCLGGQTIQNECEAMDEALDLSTPWHLLNRRLRMPLSFALMRSQRTVKCTGYFFVADNQLLVMIFKSTSSFVALFRALKDSAEEAVE